MERLQLYFAPTCSRRSSRSWTRGRRCRGSPWRGGGSTRSAPGPRHSNSQNPMCRHITSHQHITAGINGVISLCPAPSPVGFSILQSILQRIHYTNRTSVNGEGFANKHPSLNNVETKYTHPLKICAFIRVLMYKLRTTIHSPAATPLICPDSAPPTGARGRSLHLGTVILGEI